MPKLEAKQVRQELEAGWLWPVYWLYGHERMKSRELLARIRRLVLGQESAATGLGSFAEETLDGSDVTAAQVVDAAQSLSLGGGSRLVVVKDAHAIKDSEELGALLGPRAKKDAIQSVCVFLSKDLDGRKKFSKTLTEKAAVVPCEDVLEEERDGWIGFLAKRRDLVLAAQELATLRLMDPWGLDIVDQELEKLSLIRESGQQEGASVLLEELGRSAATEEFIVAFFGKKSREAMETVASFANRPEEALPLLGLLGWNVRQLACLVGGGADGTRQLRVPPHLMNRFSSWAKLWSLEEVIALQEALGEIDFSIKQTPRIPLGLWSALVLRFCRE